VLRPSLLPIEASAQAVTIDSLFRLEILVIIFLFALIMVPLIYSLIVFRRKKGETGDGEHIEGNSTLEVAWTILPLFTVLAFAYIGADNLAEVRRVDPQAYSVHVTGFRWAWKFDYPEFGGFTSKELHLVVNKQVVLQMEAPATDVIHSFWVPEFRIKQDVVPGRITEYRVTPIETGTYKVRCAELCGASHSYMEALVIVQTQEEFDAWVKQQQEQAAAELANLTPAERGQKLVTAYGCGGCHSLDGSQKSAPTWKGLFGETVALADGSTVTSDEAYITESIKNPNAKIVQGFAPNAMPQFTFTDAQIADLVEYIKTLK
jgi:cytochrome c oxidase subunit 2